MRRQRIRRVILVFAFLLFPVYLNYMSPYLMTQAAAQGILTVSFIVWLAVSVTALAAGRAFCGWGCPFHGLQLLWEKAADKPLRRVRFLGGLKYVLWTAWAGGVVIALVASGGFTRFEPLYMTPLGVSVDNAGSLVTYYALVALVLAPAALGRRGFCHYVCPFGVWAIVGTKVSDALRVPRLRLRAEAAACNDCGRCARSCPMSVPIGRLAAAGAPDANDCILCASCADECPRHALRLGFGTRR